MTSQTIDRTPVSVPPRIDVSAHAPEFYRAMVALDATAGVGLEPLLKELVRIRASQLNGCAYCMSMHTADARRRGEGEDRLAVLPAWREASCFTARERAALALTEAMTDLPRGPLHDAAYDEASLHFDADALSQLIALVTVINAWNRLGVTCRLTPGT